MANRNKTNLKRYYCLENGFKKDLENIEVHYFEGGHFVLEEYKLEIAAKIRDFLGRSVKQ